MANIQSVMHEERVFEPSAAFAAQANVKKSDADALHATAARDYEGFWADLARKTLAWKKPFTKVLDESRAPFYRWFDDGELNVSYNCLDRNLENGNADKVAIIFEADDGAVTRVTLPSSASKMIATRSPLPFSRLRSRQLYETFISPSSNHV